MAKEYGELFGEDTNTPTIKDRVNKYLAYWPLFVFSFGVCMISAVIYVRYTEPKFMATSSILVKNNQAAYSGDLIKTAINGDNNPRWDLDNQMQIFRSGPLLQRVVTNSTFNIFYYYIGKIKNSDIYLDAPFRLIPQGITDSSTSYTLKIKSLNSEGGILQNGEEDNAQKYKFKWNVPFSTTKGKSFVLSPRSASEDYGNNQYMIVWKTVPEIVGEIGSNLSVSVLGKNTSILKLDYVSTNTSRAQDILNVVYREYNLMDIEDRNVITQNTIRFIDDRLSLIARDLSEVEGNLASYQGRNQIINVETQSSQSFENANAASKEISNVSIQQGVVNMIRNYFNSPNAQEKLVPSTLGLSDPTLSSLITRYNELQLRKQRETPLVTEGSTVMKDLTNQITDLRGNILESLDNLNKNLAFQQKSLEQQNGQYKQFLTALPQKERAMLDIKRKQSVTEGLYLYLLQKREEAAISSTSSSISYYKQIEPGTPVGQIEPDGANIYLYAALLGFFLPMGFVFVRDGLNDTVTNRNDIIKKISLPILGDIQHVNSSKRHGILVEGREIVGEQFRIIRTNLSILMGKKEKGVIMVTSSGEDEGKSMISINLAAVLAIPGRKVALLEFDLRNPGISTNLNLENSTGISDYLSGESSLHDIVQVSKEISNLHIYTSGIVDRNPGDLLLNSNIHSLFNELRNSYDYVVIDSAPVTLVSDAFILGGFADASIYVVRQRKTLKKNLDFLSEVEASNKLKNISIIFNDIKASGKYGYYGYGGNYGKAYGTQIRHAKKQKVPV